MVGTDPIQFKDLRHSRVGVTTTTPRPMACTVPVVVVVTGTLQKEAWDLKVLPPVEQVRPGLWSIPVPIPNNPLRYVLVYALELDGGGVALVDAGWNTDEAWTALGDGLAAAGGSMSDVRAVMVTHIHPDHYGLAGRVREASGAWIGLHPADAVMLESRYGDTDALLDDMSHFLADSGVPADKLPDLTFASMILKSMVTMAAPDVLFEDGGDVDLPGWSLRTIWTPGHSPGHVCFYSADRRLLISGDHVLPRITPNISANTQQVPNPLGDYLESLLKVQNLGTDEVLPAHEYRFSDLEGRLEEIITHHAGRLEEIEQVIATLPGSTAWDITVRLHWSRPWDDIEPFMQRQANGETLAHCILLELHERIRRQGGTPARFYAVAG
jgi:glyoxylase-like metal-dependent hydrolase (beta-lactamase superfamily II)